FLLDAFHSCHFEWNVFLRQVKILTLTSVGLVTRRSYGWLT
ncbi:MAG: hypothetical protein ACI814_003627, partial [Mariniblastus sp.]